MKKQIFWVWILLVIVGFVMCLVYYYGTRDIDKDFTPPATQTNAVAVVATETNNLVPSGTNAPEGISLKGKVQSEWGEKK